MASKQDIIVVGGGVFGLSAAIALAERGYQVSLFEKGQIPDPLAASTDISKIVRTEYGPDAFYMDLAERAREGWLDWNRDREREGLAGLYHETGALMCCRQKMSEGGFEYESFRLLEQRGHAPQRIDVDDISSTYPAWNPSYFSDGFYNPRGGYVESSNAIEWLAAKARSIGVQLHEGSAVTSCQFDDAKIVGVSVADRVLLADTVLLAAGAWNSVLWPKLGPCIRPTGHPVFHFKPDNLGVYQANRFPTFLADISKTGYYGFPTLSDGVVKIGKHGAGVPTDPNGLREVDAEQYDKVRAFLSDAIPGLASADIVYSRLCLYADTADSDFWISEDPDCNGLFVAGGGSGHGFKFAPVLGRIIADVVQREPSAGSERFRWRPDVRQEHGNEASRCHALV